MKTKRFNTLYSNGPIFPDQYKSRNYSLKGEKLPILAEEMLVKAARFLDSDYEKEAFAPNNNMWACLKPQLTENQKTLNWPADFMSTLRKIKKDNEVLKEITKQASKADKLRVKELKDGLKDKFGTVILDGNKVRINGYMIEDANWILTRGKDPRKFLWKYAVKPEDVTLNIVGHNPPAGWTGQIKADTTAMWAIKFTMYCGPHKDGKPLTKNGCHFNKTIGFHGETDLKQKAITGKFDKAGDIMKNWNNIQTQVYNDALTGKDEALIIYLIQETGIRVGGERDTNRQAKTYGMSTLEGQHIKLTVE